MSCTDQGDAEKLLKRFLEEFPNPLGTEDPLPVSPLSRKVSLQEVKGKSLDVGLRLLSDRNAPSWLSSAMCNAAVTELLKDDLSPHYCCQDAEQSQEDEPEVVLLQSEPLQRVFINKLREVGVAWQKQLPNPGAPSLRSHSCSVHAIRNTRRKMEDRHVILKDFNQLLGLQDGVEREYYAVFDGHGGMDAATYAATHLHVVLSQQEALKSGVSAAFKNTFTQTDDMFKIKAKRERLRSGSTGVAVLLSSDWLTVAWLGDSQAMLVRQGEPVTLMNPHKPEREDEKKRIEDLGGCIAFIGCWRVNGTYAVSRAIGDFDQKPYVSNEADCFSVQLNGNEDYILLACDGFFDVIQSADVPGLVLEALSSGEDVAQSLVAQAKAAGSCDNITVLLVFLKEPPKILTYNTSSATVEGATGEAAGI
ncbi:protein phosphatase 1F [Triplophysa rosa]|uniref:Protein phosphatase 1E n=1 Tax=Triplophysa rosa TaxID=992332 RepID=A0A9W8C9F9_TRIRA|nr:protein phosphatase 1F [Triplophysa rosa]XP_057181301.1 protein phosphatase 1F [Triplophysa rosa]KAI7812336.1 protein phosphatase 1F [Triplophysa rosa]